MSANIPHIILVEDDPSLGYLLNEYLKMKDFAITWVKDGKKALEKMDALPFDLAILDVMMPEMDGFTLAARIRDKFPELPFVFLTAKSLKIDVLKGFSLGAIDYLKKPIDEEELVVRIKMLLTRFKGEKAISDSNEKIGLGDYFFDFLNQELSYKGETIKLTSRENELLRYLVNHKNRMCSHRDILQRIWGRNDYFAKKSLNVFITHLRKYLEKDSRLRIVNIHGQGFIFRVEG
ncbi:response regulator transcription factor [Ulvibacterium sp.]|uniref:response regulator transcription factor n=1 Tax=Ulvibacterium sp. TaxID=2665914 RepID=UPI003BA8ED3A